MTQKVSTDIDQLRFGQISTFPLYEQKNEDNALPAQEVKLVDFKIPRKKIRQRKRRYQRKSHDRRQYKKHRQNWLIIYLEQQRNSRHASIQQMYSETDLRIVSITNQHNVHTSCCENNVGNVRVSNEHDLQDNTTSVDTIISNNNKSIHYEEESGTINDKESVNIVSMSERSMRVQMRSNNSTGVYSKLYKAGCSCVKTIYSLLQELHPIVVAQITSKRTHTVLKRETFHEWKKIAIKDPPPLSNDSDSDYSSNNDEDCGAETFEQWYTRELISRSDSTSTTCRGGAVVPTNVKDKTAKQNIDVDRVEKTQHTRGLFTVRFSVHGLIKPGCNPGNLQWSTLTPSPLWIQSGLGQLYIPLRTNGDGSCSLHAFWGKPRKYQNNMELFCDNGRSRAAKALELVQFDTSNLARAGSVHNCVQVSLWAELTRPIAIQIAKSGSTAGFPDEEKEPGIFWNCLGSTAQESILTHIKNEIVADMTEENDQCDFDNLCRALCVKELESILIRPLCLLRGGLQHEMYNYLSMNSNDLTDLYETDKKMNDMLSSPDEYRFGQKLVKGTSLPIPEDAPLTKYHALFDQRVCFDALRRSVFMPEKNTSRV